MKIIYCIEDINDLKYVGSTKQTIRQRFGQHKKEQSRCSSKKLNLYNCIIYELERVDDDSLAFERECYWMEKLDSVNHVRGVSKTEDYKEYQKEYQNEYYEKNKEKKKQYQKEYDKNNKRDRKEYQNEYYEKNKEKRKEYRKEYYLKNNK
tara:strand:+ start:516 stop:965 length:450 start_codon:yes stop_codon:yes gene_type:complete